jgi:hypothetical protein
VEPTIGRPDGQGNWRSVGSIVTQICSNTHVGSVTSPNLRPPYHTRGTIAQISSGLKPTRKLERRRVGKEEGAFLCLDPFQNRVGSRNGRLLWKNGRDGQVELKFRRDLLRQAMIRVIQLHQLANDMISEGL